MTDFTALRSRWLHALSCEGSGLDQRTESLMALMQGAESSSGPDAGSLAASMASLLRQRSLLKDPGCDPLHQLFIEYVFSRCDAENKSHLALSCATLYPVAVQICVDSIGEAAAAPACRSAGLAASCSLALRLLTRILDLTQSAAPGRLIFMQAAAAIGAVDSLVALLQSILPVAARLGATHHGNVCGAEPCTHCSEEQAELAKISVLKCFAASLRATAVVGAGSLDASAVAVLLSASTVVRPPVLGDVLAALASVVSGDELCTQADMDAGEDIRYSLSAAAPPPRGVCPGMPTSFAFVSSGERSVATLTRKLKRFPVVATTVSDVSGASTTTWVTETVGAQAWSPLLSLFSAGVWFKANEECRGTTCVLFSIKNDFEEFSVMLKEGVLLVSISVMVIDGAAADTVGIDIELDFSSQSGQMPWSQWNHICVVQGSGEAGSSSMLIRAFLNGLASKENMVTLPPLVSFSGAAVDAADSRMDFEMSFGLEAAALDTGLPEVCLEIASIVILDRAMQSSDIQSLVAVGPTYKSGSFVNYERTPLYRPQLSSVDMSVCPPAVWRGLVQSASIPPNEKMKTRTFGLMADVNTMSVSLGLMEPCRIVLAVSNEWMLPRSRENEWTPIGNQSAPDPVIGCVLATSSVVPTGLFRIGRVYIWPMRRAPDFAALLDTSSIAALVSQLVDAAQSSQTLNLIVKFLASFLAAAPQFRVKFGLSSELSIILSSIRRKLRQQPALMDSCLSVRLLSLSGSTLGCQQGTPCQWNDFVVTDAVFFADLISDFDLWCSFPTEIFSSALHAMKIAFYTTVGSKARYFSSNKMQLQNSRVVRSILRGLLDVTFSITLDFISIVCSFLLHHFVPTDRLCRTCATEDDFEALSAALCLSARLAFETPCRTDSSGNKQFEKNYIVDFNSRCHSVAAALSSLLLEV